MSPASPSAAPEPTPSAAPNTGDQGNERNSDGSAATAGSGFGPEASRPAPTPSATPSDSVANASQRPRKGPLSFLSGALTSGLLAWLCLGLSQKVVAYYAGHPPHYSAQIAQSIATALKTLIVGMCFLATFSFAFIGLGLTLTFVRSLLPGRNAEEAS